MHLYEVEADNKQKYICIYTYVYECNKFNPKKNIVYLYKIEANT
jgi:hypothetical protein